MVEPKLIRSPSNISVAPNLLGCSNPSVSTGENRSAGRLARSIRSGRSTASVRRPGLLAGADRDVEPVLLRRQRAGERLAEATERRVGEVEVHDDLVALRQVAVR